MADADLETALRLIGDVLAEQRGTQAGLLEAQVLLKRRVDDIAETLDEALASLMRVPATIRLLLAMKACTLTMTCARCGAEYAKEDGPELCGPCWVAAGRPGTNGLHVV